jgi:hypothetical protein
VPVTGWTGMEDCLSSIVACRPEAVLDAGSGSGLWGCLLREYLDVAAGRPRPEQWRTRIDAVELEPDRVQRYARELYTEVLIGDVREVVPRRAAEVRYDVILFGEVIEGLYKDDGRALLEAAVRLAGRLVVVRIQLAADARTCGDPPLSWWSAKDFIDRTFAGHGCQVREYQDSWAVVTVPAE